MKLSKLWLQEWVHFNLTEQQLADQLTMAGLEVDAISPVSGQFNKVIVAQILNTRPHPNADKLTICEVDINIENSLQIVCGATNVRAGLKVALAMNGAILPNDFKIKESKLRGELSQGMLCSAAELGLMEYSEGILELDDNAPVGQNIREYLKLEDVTVDIDLTPNRADCFSVLGVARELSVLNSLPLHKINFEVVKPTIDDKLSISINDNKSCPRYCGRIIRNINTSAETPLWMKERLRRSGIRSIHCVVDTLNYVMLELGQPMHAYDLGKIEGGITVRFNIPDEQITLLDKQEVKLSDNVLVVADDLQALAIAGVMGGLKASVHSETQNIFLESAFFNPQTIAGVARKHTLFSDSSQRFERGVDPQIQTFALERATALIVAIAGGNIGPINECIDVHNIPPVAQFSFNMDKVKKLTGLDLSIDEMKRLLTGIEIIITKEYGSYLDIQVPSHRFDISQEVDLVEEIIRLHGYNNIYSETLTGALRPGNTCFNEDMSNQLSKWFKNKGYHETISYSFIDPELQRLFYPDEEAMQLLNPISSELSQMRIGMWPGLIASMIYNVHRQQHVIKFFEVGVIFGIKNKTLYESHCIAGLLSGNQNNLTWNEKTRYFDFYDLKGDVQSLCASFNLKDVDFQTAAHDSLHPGQSAKIVVNGEILGWIGALHPRLADLLDLEQNVFLFELKLDAFKKYSIPYYEGISKYPLIRRDLSFIIDSHITVAQIEAAVKKMVPIEWLKAFEVFDVYTGSGIPHNKKSLAIALILQDKSRTLVDVEINSLINAIICLLQDQFSIILRE